MNGVHLVVFDCDGTLVDSQHVIHAAMTAAFTEEGLAPPPREKVRGVVGLELATAITRLAPELEHRLVVHLAERYKAAFAAARQQAGAREREPLYAGMAELVGRLAAEGVLLGIATGKSLRGLTHTLVMHGLDRHFVTLQTPDVAPGKPHPGMLLQAMAATGAAPETTTMIGDTTFDIEMAGRAGVAGLGVAWGYHEPAALAAAGACGVASDAAGLARLVGESLGRPS